MKTFRFGAWPTTLVFAGLLVTAVLWLRWPGLGFNVWSLDEAIHAAAARVLLEGGVLYRDAIDQRTPLTYYAVAAVFAVFGENNLWAVRLGLAGLIAATAGLLALIATRRHSRAAGAWAGGTYVVLATALLYPGDANAVHTEWFVAFFTSAAAAVLLGAKSPPGRRRWWAAGLLLAAAFLSKQPALLELLAPLAWLAWLFRQTHLSARDALSRAGALLLGWLGLVGLVAGYFAYHGALGDAIFYAWTYNLTYYGAEISPADRFETLLLLGQLLWPGQAVLLAVWVTGGAVVVHRLLQRQPTAREKTTNGALLYVLAWTMAALAGSASLHAA
jgi:4-amino-4-deoxy-L-arabinose transferase-like glycosyltransferase